MLRRRFVVILFVFLFSSPVFCADETIPEWAQPSEKLLKALKQPMRFTIPNEKLGNVTKFMSKMTNVRIEVSPRQEDRLITLRMQTKSFRECIEALAEAAHSKAHYGAHFIYIGDTFYYPDISGLPAGLQEELKQPCALEFKYARLSAIVSFINRLTHVEFSVNEDIDQREATLRIRDLPLIECLQILCNKYDLEMRQTDENGLALESRLRR